MQSAIPKNLSVSKSDLHFYVYLYLKITFLFCWDYLCLIENSSLYHMLHSIRFDQGIHIPYSKALKSGEHWTVGI